MKFSFAIVALLGLTSAIKIRGDAPAVDPEAAAAAAPAPAATKEKGIVNEALKSEDDKAQEAVNAAGTPIDVSNAPVAAEKPKASDATPLSDAEKLRNSVLRIATVG